MLSIRLYLFKDGAAVLGLWAGDEMIQDIQLKGGDNLFPAYEKLQQEAGRLYGKIVSQTPVVWVG